MNQSEAIPISLVLLELFKLNFTLPKKVFPLMLFFFAHHFAYNSEVSFLLYAAVLFYSRTFFERAEMVYMWLLP